LQVEIKLMLHRYRQHINNLYYFKMEFSKRDTF
jgi:hypothetical protein